MLKLQQWFKNLSKNNNTEDPKLEAEHRRCFGGGGTESFIKNIWDAALGQGGVGGSLRKRGVRERKTDAIRDREEKAHQRGIRIRKLVRQPGWEDVRSILEGLEKKRYINISLPDIRGDKQSIEYWMGLQNGGLEVIRELRNELKSVLSLVGPGHDEPEDTVETLYE